MSVQPGQFVMQSIGDERVTISPFRQKRLRKRSNQTRGHSQTVIQDYTKSTPEGASLQEDTRKCHDPGVAIFRWTLLEFIPFQRLGGSNKTHNKKTIESRSVQPDSRTPWIE